MKYKIPVKSIVPFLEERLHVKFESLKDSTTEVVRNSTGESSLALDPNDEMCILAKISSIMPDRSNEVILPEGVQFKDFISNGIVVWGHDYTQLPLGTTEKIEVTNDAIYAKIRFGTTEKCKEVFQLVKEKILKALSVGFVTIETIEKGTKRFNDFVNDRLSGLGDKIKNIDRIITKSELLEISFVNIGCHQEALTQYISEKGMSASLKKDFGIKEVAIEETNIDKANVISEIQTEPIEIVEPSVEQSVETVETQVESTVETPVEPVVEEEKPEKVEEKVCHKEGDLECECEECQAKRCKEECKPVENAGSTPAEAFTPSQTTTPQDITEVTGDKKAVEIPYKSYFKVIEVPKEVSIDEIVKKQVEIEMLKRRGRISK